MLNPKELPIEFLELRTKLSELQIETPQSKPKNSAELVEKLNRLFKYKSGIYTDPTDKKRSCIFVDMDYGEIKEGFELLTKTVGKMLVADGLGNIDNGEGGVALGFLFRLTSSLMGSYPDNYEWT